MKQKVRRLLITVLTIFGTVGVIALHSYLVGGCVVRNLTTVPCPTCGMTRAAIALLSFRFADAFSIHPLIYLMAPLILIVCALYVVFNIKHTDKRYTPVYIITLIIFFIVWMIRLVFFSIP